MIIFEYSVHISSDGAFLIPNSTASLGISVSAFDFLVYRGALVVSLQYYFLRARYLIDNLRSKIRWVWQGRLHIHKTTLWNMKKVLRVLFTNRGLVWHLDVCYPFRILLTFLHLCFIKIIFIRWLWATSLVYLLLICLFLFLLNECHLR